MRIGILTDIHGDYETLRRVLDHLEALGVDRMICLGDLVVHGEHHNAVVDFFRENAHVPVVKGNHDIGASIHPDALDSLRFFSPASRLHTEQARAALSPENVEFLHGLPLQFSEGEATFTHASIGDPFAILRRPEAIASTFERMPTPILFSGHTHRSRVHHWPAGRTMWCSDSPAETRNLTLELTPGDRYIVNVGCVSQLKYDIHPPICAVYEPLERRVTFHELPDLRPPHFAIQTRW